MYANNVPTDEDILECIQLSILERCYVEIKWRVFNYTYNVCVTEEDTIATVRDRMPKRYGA